MRGPLAVRGPLAPQGVPVARSRSQRFDDLVLDAIERIERRYAAELADVEFAVEDVPDLDRLEPEPDGIPLGAVLAGPGRPTRIVIYRRPIELRTIDDGELADFVRDVVVEHVGELLGVAPEEIDPDY